MRKTVSAALMALLLNVALGVNVFAQAGLVKSNQFIGQIDTPRNETQQNGDNTDSSKKVTKEQFYKKLATTNSNSDLIKSEKDTLAAYEKQKAAGKKFSTTSKVLIGVGIAAAVIGIVVFAASRDKIETF
ncbi:MAG TPA: hypothetical protein VF540_12040 [Segetibacter sp.]|jgi:hypothetical protein